MFRSIKNKLIFLFLIAVLTPLLVMRLIAYPSAQKVIQETTIGNLQSIGSKKVSQVNDWLQKLETTAERIANNPLVAEAVNLTKADADTVSKFLSHIPYDALFHRFMISDVSGNIRISADDKLIGLNISDIQGFHRALNGKTYISDIVSSVFYDSDEFGNRSEQLPAMYVFAPAMNQNGHVIGVMVFQADLSVLNNEMEEIHGDSYDAYIINQHGVMITESKFADQLKKIGLITKRTTMELAIVEPRTKKFTRSAESCLKGIDGFDTRGYTNHRGQKVLGVWYWIPEIKWGVITEMSAEEVSLAMNNLKNPFSKIFSYLTITGVILAVAGIAFAFLIGQKIARPIMGLTTATRKMSAGDLSQRVTIKTEDEVRELGDAFNAMAKSVQEKTSKLQETTNFLNSILVSSTEHAIIASDLGGNILAFNEGAKRMYGYEPDELIFKSNIKILHAKTDAVSNKVLKILETTLQTGIYKNEMQLVRKNGEIFTGYSTFTTRRATDGRPIGFVTITRDITKQKLLELELHDYTVRLEKIVEERTRKLRISEEKYRRLFETSKDVVFFCDSEGYFIDINQAGVDLFGYESKNEILKLNLAQHLFFNPDEGKIIKEMVYRNGFIKDYEVELKKKDGIKVPSLMTSNLRRDERNNVVGYEGIIIDLTERKRIEQEKDIVNNINKILASKLDIREVFKSLTAELNQVIDFDRMSVTLLDDKREEFLIFAVSKDYDRSRLEEGMHYSKYGTLAGKVVDDGEVYMVNDTSRGAFSTDPILYKEGIKSRMAFPLIYKGETIGSVNFGSRKVNNFSENQLFDFVSKIAPQLAIAIDNTRLFDRIKESEEKYRNLVEDIEDVIFRMDKTGRYLFLNNALQKVTGYFPQEFYETPSIATEMIHKDDVRLVKETMQKILDDELKVSKDLEYRIYCKNGKELWLSQNTYPIKNKNGSILGVEGIIRDITDRKKIEDQIRRSERLASIGELAASIAHEIRNPLGAISNSVCMLKRDLALDGDDQKLFEMVVEETDRLNSIITNFLTFAHPAEYHFVRSDILAIIDETLLLLQRDERFNEKIKIIKVYENDVPRVYLDQNWIRKVFWNLLVNSIDAMPRGGKIYIHVRRPNVPNNEEIEIVVADTGKGIPPEIMKKIFEPFFTTKKAKGTGLGLPIVHRIVDNHGGVIDVKSERNKGTAFTIRLPIKNKQVKTVLV
ncbi:MAG TPA: PAS domain S-box protein [Candidatus Wunengus sp. YC63]|uniref:PAS domain S-box protein n=3 Tax=unclassified Candidatus Wunengus TaxID=3367695 RepID=UPI004025D0B6